jgi:hypothetical protein
LAARCANASEYNRAARVQMPNPEHVWLPAIAE